MLATCLALPQAFLALAQFLKWEQCPLHLQQEEQTSHVRLPVTR